MIHFLESGGFFNGFVNNFTIEYSMSDSGDDFEAYGVLEKPQVSLGNFNEWDVFTLGVYIHTGCVVGWLGVKLTHGGSQFKYVCFYCGNV